MIKSEGNFLAYNFEKGTLLSEIKDKNVFNSFLDFANKNFWSKKYLKQKKIVDKACKNFYKDKTYSRIDMYFKRSSFQDKPQIINKVKVPKISNILQKLIGIICLIHIQFYFMETSSQKIFYSILKKNLFYLIGEKILEVQKFMEIFTTISQNSIMLWKLQVKLFEPINT